MQRVESNIVILELDRPARPVFVTLQRVDVRIVLLQVPRPLDEFVAPCRVLLEGTVPHILSVQKARSAQIRRPSAPLAAVHRTDNLVIVRFSKASRFAADTACTASNELRCTTFCEIVVLQCKAMQYEMYVVQK